MDVEVAQPAEAGRGLLVGAVRVVGGGAPVVDGETVLVADRAVVGDDGVAWVTEGVQVDEAEVGDVQEAFELAAA